MKQGWEIKKVGDCFESIKNGANIKQERGATGIPITRIETLSGGVFNRDRLGYANILSSEKYISYVLDDGDLLLSHINSKTYIGRTVVYNKQGNEDIIHGMNLLRLKVIRKILSPYYAYYCFKSDLFRNQVASYRKDAVNQSSIPVTDLKKINIPIPPLSEQEKIVEELDCLSGIIEKKKQQSKEYDALAHSIFYEMFGNVNEFTPLSFYIDSLSAGKSLAGEDECPNKVLKTGAVTYDYFDGRQVKNLPLEYTPIENHKVKVKDVLISRMNTAELVGACAYVWNIDDSTYLPDRLWRAEIRDNSNPIYLWKAIITDKAKEQIRNYASGTSGSMKNISKSSFLKVQIPKVSLSEQKEFASKIEAIEKQKELIKQSIAETETLFNSRMDYYFG